MDINRQQICDICRDWFGGGDCTTCEVAADSEENENETENK